MNFSDHDFRRCLGSFATGVTVVTTRRPNGAPEGITINSFASVSLDPPLVLFNLDKHSVNYPHFKECQSFAVNILSEKQLPLSNQFAQPSVNRWQETHFTTDHTNSPILTDVAAYLECAKEAIYEGGDHSIFIGKVVNLKYFPEQKPLIFFRGSYTTLDNVKPSQHRE